MYNYRPATHTDFTYVCQLVTNEEELFRVYPSGHYPLTVEQLEDIAQERTALTVIEHKKRIVGFGNLYHHIPGKQAFIGNIIVHAEHRGRGIGKALVQYMMILAFEEHQLPQVCISVFSDNTPALLLYTALGFTPYEIEERITPCGQRAALIHMRVSQ